MNLLLIINNHRSPKSKSNIECQLSKQNKKKYNIKRQPFPEIFFQLILFRLIEKRFKIINI